MKKIMLATLFISALTALAYESTSLTVYNANFAVVRETLPLDLEKGLNRDVSFNHATRMAEPDSVVLRDPNGRADLQIVEQSYRNDPVSEKMLLERYLGETIPFERHFEDGIQTVFGKIIRSGYLPGVNRYSSNHRSGDQPIIELDGKLRFSLPGKPLFPALKDDTLLKPAFSWILHSDRKISFDAQLSYISSGLKWEAAYNLIASPTSDSSTLGGWVTLENNCGQNFENASVKLMAGDINKIKQNRAPNRLYARSEEAFGGSASAVEEKSFDEYHLYTLKNPLTIRDRETKQVEFVRTSDLKTKRIYVYDGAKGVRSGYWAKDNRSYGTQCTKEIRINREFENSEQNGLGVPLPAGRIRFYQQDGDDSNLEFLGENRIDHTPKNETIRVYTGNAFDLKGERRQTDYHIDNRADWLDESFEIKLRNHKEEAVEIKVIEHLYRWQNSRIKAHSLPYERKDSHTLEFNLKVPPQGEKSLKYTVHYSW